MLKTLLGQRSIIMEKHENSVEWIPGVVETVKSYCIAPIIASGDPIGAVFIISKVHFIGESELKAIETAANFLAKQMES